MSKKCTPEECEKLYNSGDKWRVSVLAGLIFMLVSAPFLYQLGNSLFSKFGISTASASGCPNFIGLFIHTAIFILITRLLMK